MRSLKTLANVELLEWGCVKAIVSIVLRVGLLWLLRSLLDGLLRGLWLWGGLNG